MLYFVSKELALSYLFFSFLSALGVLQLVAAHYRLVGLAFFDYPEHRAWGYGLGILLIVGSFAWFFASRWTDIFAPGLAGAELSLLFGAGVTCALFVTLLTSPLLQRLFRGTSLLASGEDKGQVVAVGHTTGRLYIPAGFTSPLPAICLVPGLRANGKAMNVLAHHMAQAGLIALVVCPEEEAYTYPGILAILPAAISLLRKLPEVDPQRLGALGHDLGGDLVIRAASVDKQIKAVAALAPILVETPVGLDLLREMSYLQALRWVRDHKRAKLRADLDAFTYGAKIVPRPFLLLYGTEDRLVTYVPIEQWYAQHRDAVTLKMIQGGGHLNLLRHPMVLHTVIQWFKEHL